MEVIHNQCIRGNQPNSEKQNLVSVKLENFFEKLRFLEEMETSMGTLDPAKLKQEEFFKT